MNNTSTDGNCGSNSDSHVTCIGSIWGNCCSEKGYCGNTTAYCGEGCQLQFGECNDASVQTISTTGSCGATLTSNVTCLGSTYGDCCSGKGYCGGDTAYCGSGCQGEFGRCVLTNDDEEEEVEEEEEEEGEEDESTSSAVPGSTSTATPTPILGSDSSSDGGLSKGAVAGISVGSAVAGLAIIAFILWFFLFRKRKSSAQDETKLVDDPKDTEPVMVRHEMMNGKEMHEMEARAAQAPAELPGN
ncbi:uncharacterized protein BDV17DRAFT_295562 [Aspergillus undulatus]|uniref:uncharacterized protein n=1 Tax=Aspergillus undulatus TaxID=1810928 RepID=UPI003CCD229F